jgi:hypothetical protein
MAFPPVGSVASGGRAMTSGNLSWAIAKPALPASLDRRLPRSLDRLASSSSKRESGIDAGSARVSALISPEVSFVQRPSRFARSGEAGPATGRTA